MLILARADAVCKRAILGDFMKYGSPKDAANEAHPRSRILKRPSAGFAQRRNGAAARYDKSVKECCGNGRHNATRRSLWRATKKDRGVPPVQNAAKGVTAASR